MNETEPIGSNELRTSRAVFVSYATTDRKQALSVCEAIERRGVKCWISIRDVKPGENYQEAIVQAIRNAAALVLVFSRAANASDEIKKELSLGSRYRIPVIALRLEDVMPSDAFAYELSTRQWIDAFKGWDKGIDALAGRIAQLSGAEPVAMPAGRAAVGRPARSSWQRAMIAAASGVMLLLIAGATWWWLRPTPALAHSMTARLSGFKPLSVDLPATIGDAVDAEIAAAFNADGVVGVSAATSPPTGTEPAYALGGTIQRDGQTISVITRLVNERSGATLWSDKFSYDGNEVSRVPRHIAVDTGNIVRCGLFGASTYHKPLPDSVLRDYMQFCQGHWDPETSAGRKALVPAQRAVAAAPDFSWGWAAVAGGYWKVASNADTDAIRDDARSRGRKAADRAVALDARNSEALYIKSMLLDRHDWLGREGLLKRAVAARRLDCGCEHHQYGWLLLNVGRTTEAVDELRRATDMLALYVYTPQSLAEALVAAGKPDEASKFFDMAVDLAPNAESAKQLAMIKTSRLGDLKLWLDLTLPFEADLRAAMVQGYRAVASGDAAAMALAVKALLALPDSQQNSAVARLLGSLGADHQAFLVAARIAKTQEYPGPSLFWYPSMRGALADPGFPALAKQLGLMSYWKTSRTKPDVCSEKAAPQFCRLI